MAEGNDTTEVALAVLEERHVSGERKLSDDSDRSRVSSPLKLYFHYIAISLRAQMQYRISFLMRAAAHFLITFTEFLGIAALFGRFGQIRGWTLPEMALFYGIISTAFAIAEGFARGFDSFARYVRNGDFDRILVRPRSPALQVLGIELQLMRIGRFAQGALVLAWAAYRLDIHWSAWRIALLTESILGGACLFAGIIVIQATTCFWTIESIEIFNCATYGGVEAAQFPLSIYKSWLRHFFTWVVPLATINYFPAHALLNRPDPLGTSFVFQTLCPLAGPLFLAVALVLWTQGVRHYKSTGS